MIHTMIHEEKACLYSFKQLSMLYSPDLQPDSASKQLIRWVMLHPTLKDKLVDAGWHKGARRLSPLMVSYFYECLGVP